MRMLKTSVAQIYSEKFSIGSGPKERCKPCFRSGYFLLQSKDCMLETCMLLAGVDGAPRALVTLIGKSHQCIGGLKKYQIITIWRQTNIFLRKGHLEQPLGIRLTNRSNAKFFKNGPIPASFVYFRYFLDTISIIQIEKSVDGVLGI